MLHEESKPQISSYNLLNKALILKKKRVKGDDKSNDQMILHF